MGRGDVNSMHMRDFLSVILWIIYITNHLNRKGIPALSTTMSIKDPVKFFEPRLILASLL